MAKVEIYKCDWCSSQVANSSAFDKVVTTGSELLGHTYEICKQCAREIKRTIAHLSSPCLPAKETPNND